MPPKRVDVGRESNKVDQRKVGSLFGETFFGRQREPRSNFKYYTYFGRFRFVVTVPTALALLIGSLETVCLAPRIAEYYLCLARGQIKMTLTFRSF